MSTLCLNMIVKNEAAVIDRCLVAVAPFLTAYVICDTGSTDGTPEIIRNVLRGHGVPGEVHHVPFRDFAQARNLALDRARASTLPFDYLLLLDADMELVASDLAFAGELTAPVYLLRQEGAVSYYNTRLLRRDHPAHYIGATHEYLDAGTPGQRLESAWFIDHADGANRTEKFRRDIRLLTAALEQHPDDPRTLFYLAQSYKDIGKPELAVPLYERRIAVGGWKEEVWYARYMLATCHFRLGDEARFIQHSLEAYDLRPNRAEPLLHLARYYRETGKHDACLALCEMGLQIPYPAADSLFIEPEAYHRGFFREIGISGFYSQLPERRIAGREACFRSTTDRAETPQWRWSALNNATYYARNAAAHFDDFAVMQLQLTTDVGFSPFNPSVAIHAGRRYCVYRTSNIKPDGTIRPESGLDFGASRNHVIKLDESFQPVWSTTIDEHDDPGPVYDTGFTGFEDSRLIWFKGRPLLSCTSLERNPEGRSEIVLLELSEEWIVTGVHVQRSQEPMRPQKNWMPFISDGELHFIYTLEPLVVLRLDEMTMQATPISSTSSLVAAGLFRGGSQIIPIESGWLAVTHEVAQPVPPDRFYLHRFLAFDLELRLTAMSDPFYFVQKGIEFCAGLARDPETERLVVSFGVGDTQAWLGFVNETAVRERLRPV